jgi:NADH-quinone oxidoreductase E subunit
MSAPTKSFAFTPDRAAQVKEILAKYPEARQKSAILPLLHLAQEQEGWISGDVVAEVARILQIPEIRVWEVVTFYTMFNQKPVGKFHIQVCGTTPCWLRGSEKIMRICKKKLGIEKGETTADGLFTLSEVECLGGCANAPVVQINHDYYEDLGEEEMLALLKNLQAGKEVQKGSQKGRRASEPVGAKNGEKPC